MNKKIINIVPVGLMLMLASCAMSVRDAYAPTNPPKVQKNLFSAKDIEGNFTGTTTLMFLWPEQIKDEATGELVPMTFAQKAESRKNIVRYDEEKRVYEELYLRAEKDLDEKYNGKLQVLEQDYRNLKCYAMCDVEDFSCEPDNPDNLFQDTWKITEDEEELQLIATCQANEADRRSIDVEKGKEKDQVVTPLQKKAGEAALNLLNAVGDRNFFNNLSSFELIYGPKSLVRCGAIDRCLPEGHNHNLVVRVGFSGGIITNGVDGGAIAEVMNLKLDVENGYLTFTIPAIDFDNGNKEYGKIHFDLELNPAGPKLNVTGDIHLESYETGTTRVGRFSSSGDRTPLL